MGGDPNCTHEWDKNNCVLCNRKRPYKFQLDGMKFTEAGLAVNKGAAIFDEMGLGKTIQAGAVVFFNQTICSPTLYIVKAGLKHQWASFIINWMPGHFPQIINSSKDVLWPGMKHYIIGYDMLVSKTRTLKSGKTVTSGFDISKFDAVGIKCVVLDECQQIKNVDSTRTQMVRKVVRDKKVIALSGTPWNNRGSELFPVLNMLAPMKFSSPEKFKREWVSYYYQGSFIKEGGIKRIPQFKEYTKDIVIRRERTEVMPELPLVNRTKLNVVMDEGQEAVYDAEVEKFVEWYEDQVGEISGMAIIAAMQKMRHLVALAKVPATLEHVAEFVENTDRKLAVFAHHIDVQAILYDELKTAHGLTGDKDRDAKEDRFPVLRYAAEMNSEQRNNAVIEFNNSPRAIFVMSQGAGGEGLNLQTCADCIMHERQWNPGREEQCEGRFIRIGSAAASVNAIYTHLEGITAIDAQLDGIVERKRIQYHEAMSKGETPKWNEDALMRDLAASIVNSHNAKKNRKVLASK